MPISIVVPLYNKEQHIENTINCVLNQTYQDFEIVVINDGSTDRSAEIVRQIKDPRIRLIDQPNGGASNARNNGVRLAQNELVAFLDADDEWRPEYLSKMHALAERYPDALLYGSNYEIVENNESVVLDFPGVKAGEAILDDYFKAAEIYTPLWTTAVVVRKDTFLSLGGFPETCKVCEDIDLWCRFALRGAIAYINEPLAIYCRNSSNMLSRSTDASAYFPFLQEYQRLVNTNVSRYDSVLSFVVSRKYAAISYALFTSFNNSEARRILKNLEFSGKNDKKFWIYKILSYMPCFVKKSYLKLRKAI